MAQRGGALGDQAHRGVLAALAHEHVDDRAAEQAGVAAPRREGRRVPLAQAPGEPDVGEGDAEAPEQLAEGAQALQLAGAVEPVAAVRSRGHDQARTLDVAEHSRRPARRLGRLVDGQRIHRPSNLTTSVSRFAGPLTGPSRSSRTPSCSAGAGPGAGARRPR